MNAHLKPDDAPANESIMREAIALSVKNVLTGNGGPFAAVVVQNGKIIATGTNEVTKRLDPTAHAEVVAIRNACEKLKTFQLLDCEIYTTCEPCPMCLGAIYWARPRRVFFGNTRAQAASIGFDDSLIYQEIEIPFDQRKIPMNRLLGDEALSAFQEWTRTSTKIEY